MASSENTLPVIDSRSEQEIVDQTTQLATFYTGSNWSVPTDGSGTLDLGGTLIQIFARMMSHVITRLNQVPEKNHLAFLDLLGAQRRPPRPARVPLTFQPVDGGGGTVVPAGTPVAAPADELFPEAVFTTDTELVLTPATLVNTFVHDPTTDMYSDVSAIATGASGVFVAFAGTGTPPDDLDAGLDKIDTQAPHYLLLTHPLLGLATGTATVTFALTMTEPNNASDLKWERFQSDGKPVALSAAVSNTLASVSVPLPIAAVDADGSGVARPWVRVSWPKRMPKGTTSPLTVNSVSVSVQMAAALPDQAFLNAAPVDLSKDFLPFGERPRLSDTLYVTDADALQPGATITVTMTNSDPMQSPPAPLALPLTWEYWDGTQWTFLAANASATFTGSSISPPLTLGGTVGITTVNGVAGRWLRVRVSSPVGTTADPTKRPFVDYLPPSLKSIKLTMTSPTVTITGGTTQNGFDVSTWAPGQGPFVVYRADQDKPALYLGFDQKFANRPTNLYVQVDPPTPKEVAPQEPPPTDPVPPPRLVWEYMGGDGKSPPAWTTLPVDDETFTLTRSGLVQFIGPADLQPSAVFGQQRHWLRGKLIDNTSVLQRRLRRISANTVLATHAATTVNEIVGGSNGSPDQTFKLSQTPVLLGQRIEVNEGQPLSSEELEALAELEGDDAVTVVPAAATSAQQVWVRWHGVADFFASGPSDRHYLFDHLSGTLTFGNGTAGRIPIAGNQNIRASWYQSGGGAIGNRPAGAVAQLRTALPYVESVRNNEDSAGGSDAESLARVKARSSSVLRHGWRAVAAQDFEDLAFEATTTVARAVAVTPTFDPNELSRVPQPPPEDVLSPGNVLVIVVPWSSAPKPVPTPELLTTVRDYLRARCAPAVGLQVTGPRWASVQVNADIVVSAASSIEAVRTNVLAAINRFLHPLTGNSDGNGWAFGQQPQASDIYLLLSTVPGIDHIGALTVTCTPPLEKETTATLDEQRSAKMTLIYSSNTHVISPLLAAAARLQAKVSRGGTP